jgi:hypothetical protein
MMWSLLLLSSAAEAQAACQATLRSNDLAQIVSTADAAFGEMDAEAFMADRARAQAQLPCLSEAISPGHAASYHRMLALGSFLDRSRPQSVDAFRAVLSIAPGYQLSESIAPEDHPLREWFSAAQESPAIRLVPLPPPRRGWIYIDGRPSTVRPGDRPYIFQYFDETGKLVTTAWVSTEGTLPLYPMGRAEGTASLDRESLVVPLWVGTGLAAATSGGLLIAAHRRADEFWGVADPSEAELSDLRDQTNRLAGAALAFGVVAAGTGSAALIVGQW